MVSTHISKACREFRQLHQSGCFVIPLLTARSEGTFKGLARAIPFAGIKSVFTPVVD